MRAFSIRRKAGFRAGGLISRDRVSGAFARGHEPLRPSYRGRWRRILARPRRLGPALEQIHAAFGVRDGPLDVLPTAVVTLDALPHLRELGELIIREARH